MLNRISRITAVALLSGFAALYSGMTFAQNAAPTREDRVISTRSVGQAANGDRVYSTTSLTPPDPVSNAVRERFLQRFDGVGVTAVRRTPYGMFEVQIDVGDLVYTDENVSWIMQGQLIDSQSGRNVTRERQQELNAVVFDELPLKLAIKKVKGDGSRKIAIFEDPNCGYCKRLRHTLEEIDNLTIYTFLYPILSPDSTVKVNDIWCAKKPADVLDDWMLRGKTPPNVTCDAPLKDLVALGRKLKVQGTPTLFFQDGQRVGGALPLEDLVEHLERKAK